MPTSHRRFFRVAAVLLPLLLLAAIEVFLRLSGYGYSTRMFLERRIQGRDVLIDNASFGRRFFPEAVARTPQPQILTSRKVPGTIRLFVLGESAAMGDPEPSFGLPRMLQAMLELTFPSNRFEVINVAMTAINSHVVREIARDCAELEGDAWVVYMGNNEVIGPFGSGTVFGQQVASRRMIRAVLWFRQFRLAQLIESRTRRTAFSEWKGLEMFLRHQVPRDDPRMEKVYAHFQDNLREIIRLGTNAGAKVIVSTVAVNLEDSPPFASQLRRSALDPGWARDLERGVKFANDGGLSEAYAAFLRAEERVGGKDHGYAGLYFHLARCESALGRFEEARTHFNQAREHDTLRFRADDQINQIIQRSAGGGGEAVRFVDGANALARQSSNGIPGAPLFHEHVHLTFEGNYELARSLMREILLAVPALRQSPRAAPSLEDCARRLAWTDFNRLEVCEEMRARLQKEPFRSQFGHAKRDRALQELVERLSASLTPERYERLTADYSSALSLAPDDWVLHENFAKLLEASGNAPAALAQWREVTRLLPHDTQAYCRIGDLLTAMGEGGRAIGFYREALRHNSELAEARHGLALAFAERGQLIEAERELKKVLRRHPSFVEARVNLGRVFLRRDQRDAALHEFQLVLQQDSTHGLAHLQLGALFSERGDKARAVRHYESALRVDPENSAARKALHQLQRTK